MPRIVYEANGVSAHQLERMADELDLSKVKALQLAVSVLSKLSEEIGRGTEIVLRQQGGREVELWLPHLRRLPLSEPASSDAVAPENPRSGKHSAQQRGGRHSARTQKE